MIIAILFLVLSAFGAGYWVRSWQLDTWPPALVGDVQGDGVNEPIIRDELYQQVWTLLERDFYGEDPTLRQRIYGSVRGLADTYNDPYTYFVEPQPRELERDQLRGSFGGIGAYIDVGEDGYTLRPIPGQPAEVAGVLAGDRLLAVDDVDVTQETDVDAVLLLVRGPVGSEVCLDLERVDAASQASSALRICIERAEIQTPSVEWRLLDDDEATRNVGYIRHSLFSERSADEMLQAIQELQAGGATRFVLDLRGNPGGLVDTAVAIADLWLDEGTVLIERKASGEDRIFRSQAGDVSQGAPLVLLVDGGTASAGEIVAGALHDRGRALLVGQQTFGKGSVQLVHDLVDQSSLHVTTARWYTPDDNAIDGVGLTPDVLVEGDVDPLARAVETVQSVAAAP
ncbi:MAG: S41 family peptidase [Caldilineaceae bacterium]|nr:S41 family peptidase [Caldilineaceae bacterium]